MYQVDQGAYWESQALYWGPKILIALAILLATWFVARAAKWVIQKAIDRSPALKKHIAGTPNETVGHQLGTVVKLIIWLVGIMAALSFLGVGQILEPINALTLQIFEFLPRVLAAGLIFFVGLILARILRRLVETLLTAANIDGILARLGVNGSDQPRAPGASSAVGSVGTTGGPAAATSTRTSLAKAAGILVFAFVIFPVGIGALQALGVESISGPASALLTQILQGIPGLLSAALWLLIAFVAGKFLKSIIEALLPPLGFDDMVRSLEVVPASTSPSRVVANVAMIAVILLFAIEAAKQLGGGTIALFLAQITELGGKVIFGTLIIVAGIFLARIISRLVASGTGEGGYAQTIVKYAIIALFTAIGLTFMGLADQIVMLAFGLILGSAAIAAALAFGLGGRDWAAKRLEEMSRKSPTTTTTPTPPTQTGSPPPLV